MKRNQRGKDLILRSFITERSLYEKIRLISNSKNISISSFINQLLEKGVKDFYRNSLLYLLELISHLKRRILNSSKVLPID